MKISVLSYEVNEYDQQGKYILTAYDHLPTREELKKALSGFYFTYPTLETVIDNLYSNTGGRLSYEYEWFYLNTIESGELVQEKQGGL